MRTLDDGPYDPLAEHHNLVFVINEQGRIVSFNIKGITRQSLRQLRLRLGAEPQCSLIRTLLSIRPDVLDAPTITFNAELNHVIIRAPGHMPNGRMLDAAAQSLLQEVIRFA